MSQRSKRLNKSTKKKTTEKEGRGKPLEKSLEVINHIPWGFLVVLGRMSWELFKWISHNHWT